MDPDPAVRASRSPDLPGPQVPHLWNEEDIIYSDLVLPRILGVRGSCPTYSGYNRERKNLAAARSSRNPRQGGAGP